jgi:hypothetical protein
MEYQCVLDPNGPLASRLQAGQVYRLHLTGKDLGIKHWFYHSEKKISAEGDEPFSKVVQVGNPRIR